MTRPNANSTPGTFSTGVARVRPVSLSELRRKMDRSDGFVFVMAMDRRRYEKAHIDGSMSLDDFLEIMPTLGEDAEIVVYCTGPECAAGKLRSAYLTENGFCNVYRYAGGLAEWTAAGLPVVEGPLHPA